MLAIAFAPAATAALAQAVVPGTAPGAQTGNPSTNQQRPNSKRMGKMSANKNMMRENGKMKTKP